MCNKKMSKNIYIFSIQSILSMYTSRHIHFANKSCNFLNPFIFSVEEEGLLKQSTTGREVNQRPKMRQLNENHVLRIDVDAFCLDLRP